MNYLKFVNFEIFDLGKEYLFGFNVFNEKYFKRVKLIKPTAKGYNFLDIKTNKCILKRHLYPNKIGQIVLHKSILIVGFEIELFENEERFINLESLC